MSLFLTLIESNGLVLRPHGALIVLPCMGSLTHVTISPAWRTALIRWGSLIRMLSAPILVIIVSLPGLLCGLRISHNFTSSFGSILSLTCVTSPGIKKPQRGTPRKGSCSEIKIKTKRRESYYLNSTYVKHIRANSINSNALIHKPLIQRCFCSKVVSEESKTGLGTHN